MLGPVVQTRLGDDVGRMVPADIVPTDGEFIFVLGRQSAGHVVELAIGDRLVVQQLVATDGERLLQPGAFDIRAPARMPLGSSVGPWDLSEEPVLEVVTDAGTTEIELTAGAFADPAAALPDEVAELLNVLTDIRAEVRGERLEIYAVGTSVLSIVDPSAIRIAPLIWIARVSVDGVIAREVVLSPERNRALADVVAPLVGADVVVSLELELRLDGERYGMQIDDDVVLFWTMGTGALGGSVDDVVPDTGSLGLDLSVESAAEHFLVGGPMRDRWARRFSGTAARLRSAGTIGSANVEALFADITIEAFVRVDADVDGCILAIGGPTDGEVDELLQSVRVTPTRALVYQVEIGGTEQDTTSPDEVFELGTWFHLVVTVVEDVTPGFLLGTIYVDGVEVHSGTVAGPLVGLVPGTGEDARICVGAGAETPIDPLDGAIGDLRVLNRVMTEEEIADDAALLSKTFVLPTEAGELVRYRLDTRPSLVDVVGDAHATAETTTPAPSTLLGASRLDLVGSRGSAVPTSAEYLVSVRELAAARAALVGLDWTLEMFVLPDVGSTGVILECGGSGELAAGNILLSVSVVATRKIRVEWEQGAGTDEIFETAASAFTAAQEAGVLHLAVRSREDGSSPGDVRIAVFVNGVLAEESAAETPADGGADAVLRLGGGWSGRVQEVRLSAVARSNDEIRLSAGTRRP
jgi:hypothetical protein